MSFYAPERMLVEHLQRCLEHCAVQGVPDYFWVHQYGKQFAKRSGVDQTRAGVYVFYAGERVVNEARNACCIVSRQLYVIAVVTVNLCQQENGALSRQENGVIVDKVICCMAALCDSGCGMIQRVNVPQLPIPLDDNGIVTTFLAYEIERSDVAACKT